MIYDDDNEIILCATIENKIREQANMIFNSIWD